MARPRTPAGAYGVIKLERVRYVRSEDGNGKKYSVQRVTDEEAKQLEPSEILWRARTLYRSSENSRRRQIERIAKSKVKAEHALKAAILEFEDTGRRSITRKTTIDELAEKFLQSKRDIGSPATTLNKYASHAKLITSELGHMTVGFTTTSILSNFLTMVNQSKGYSTAKGCRNVLSGMMQMAVADDTLTHNPVQGVPRLKQPKGHKGAKPLTLEQLNQMIDVLVHDDELRRLDIAELFLFMLFTGCRIGEACGLRWIDIDWQAGTVTFAVQPARIPGEGLQLVEQLKTDGSYRAIELPAQLRAILAQRAETLPVNEHNLIFPSMLGHIRDISNTGRDWRRNRDRLNFPEFTSHGFRKSIADILSGADIPIRDISIYLGHEDSRTTEKHYLSKHPPTKRQADVIAGIVGISSE